MVYNKIIYLHELFLFVVTMCDFCQKTCLRCTSSCRQDCHHQILMQSSWPYSLSTKDNINNEIQQRTQLLLMLELWG